MFSDVIAPKETLLCAPGSEEPLFDRQQLSYSGCSERFRLGERSFSRQYAHIYATRLMQMRDILNDRAAHKWGETPLESLTGSCCCCVLPEALVNMSGCVWQAVSCPSGSCVTCRWANSV